jgi:glutamate racemase
MRNSPIGVFDSGVGGLTVVKELTREMPNEDIVYFGDTARVPYGTKSASTIQKFSIQNVLFLLKRNVKLIIIACNTSSAIGLPFLSKYFSIPIIGVIKPGAKAAVRSTRNGRIGVIGTSATVLSGAYDKEIKALNSGIKVYSGSCPLFVPLAEEGWANDGIVDVVARKYLAAFKGRNIDTLIMGCTHYPLLRSSIRRVMGKGVKLIDSAEETAKEARGLLEECGLKSAARRKNRSKFYVSDAPDKFRAVARRFLGRDAQAVERVDDV